MGTFRPIFGNFNENQTQRKQTSDISFQSLRAGEFENKVCFAKYSDFTILKKALLNFPKYIVAHILAKFKFFAKQTLFLNSPAHKL